MTVMEEQGKYFCYLLIKQKSEAWTGVAFMALALILPIIAARQYHKAHSLSMINLSVKLIYITIFLWAVLFLGKIAFAETLFWQQREQEETDKVYEFDSIVSKYLLVIDISGVFLLQTTLVLVCYNWVNDLVKQMIFLEGGGASDANVDVRFLKHEIMCQKLLKFYLIARFFFYLLVIPFVVISQPYYQILLAKIMLILLLVQALFVSIILGLGIALIKRNKKIKEMVSPEDIAVMLNQYIILIICSMVRVILDTIFVSYNFQRLAGEKCFVNDIRQGFQVLNLLNFVLGDFFTHCLPIYIVLRIYNVRVEDMDLSQSLLAAAESYNSSSCQINPPQQTKQ